MESTQNFRRKVYKLLRSKFLEVEGAGLPAAGANNWRPWFRGRNWYQIIHPGLKIGSSVRGQKMRSPGCKGRIICRFSPVQKISVTFTMNAFSSFGCGPRAARNLHCLAVGKGRQTTGPQNGLAHGQRSHRRKYPMRSGMADAVADDVYFAPAFGFLESTARTTVARI